MPVHILALVGSLRSGSHNRQLAEAAVKHAPEGVQVTLYDGLAEVPFYNEDIDTDEQRPAAGPHDLRHYFTVRLLDERVPAARAGELLAGL
jgi:hypothetical protein